jgi:hypothetical protein
MLGVEIAVTKQSLVQPRRHRAPREREDLRFSICIQYKLAAIWRVLMIRTILSFSTLCSPPAKLGYRSAETSHAVYIQDVSFDTSVNVRIYLAPVLVYLFYHYLSIFEEWYKFIYVSFRQKVKDFVMIMSRECGGRPFQ